MDKREFLKTSAAILVGGIASNLMSAEEPLTNWSGNYRYHAARVLFPNSVKEVQEAVKSSKKLKGLGSRHSFNSIADTTGDQISVKNLRELKIDKASGTVTIGGGLRYGDIAPYLDQHGYALHNLASLPHITVVGACDTATHGSGVKNGNSRLRSAPSKSSPPMARL